LEAQGKSNLRTSENIRMLISRIVQMENGYHLYTFAGQPIREEPIEGFKQWAWRPRPERLLSKDEMKTVRKNLREYSKQFDEIDQAKKSSANKAVVDARRRLLEEWLSWRQQMVADLREEREELGLPEVSEEMAALEVREEDGAKVVEEIFEEILEESEEVIE
jgi:translation initiation factor 3 subunit B